MKRKLLIVIWDMALGGIQKRVRDLILEINTNQPDWEIHLLLKFEEPAYFLDSLADCKNLHLHFYKKNREQLGRSLPLAWIIQPFFSIKPDVCLTFLEHLSISMVIVKHLMRWRKDSRLVLNEGILTSTYLGLNKDILGWKPYAFLIKIFYRFSNLIIVPTKEVKEDLVFSFKVPSNKIKVISNWTLFPPKSADKKRYDLIYVTRYEREKNPKLFLEIIDNLKKKLPNIKGCLVGEGSLKKELVQFVKDHKLDKNVKILDFQANTQAFLLDSKIFVITSKNEGMPNVVLEAGISSLPTVSTNFRGSNEVIIQGKTGYILKDGSVTEFTHYCFELLKNDVKRKKMGQAAQRHIVQNFSYNTQQKFIKYLLKV
ncbi:MAG: glycosyltransferase [Patescibacteria group bacterium]